jgi:hypothetical protein
MRRELVWVERHEGWGCSQCALVFSMAAPPIGNSIDKMKRHFEMRRDKEFASHVCADHSRAKNPKTLKKENDRWVRGPDFVRQKLFHVWRFHGAATLLETSRPCLQEGFLQHPGRSNCVSFGTVDAVG